MFPTRRAFGLILSCGLFALGLGGCHGAGSVGSACKVNGDCHSPLSCVPDFPGGYCTTECSDTDCPADEVCGQLGGANLCLKACNTAADCRGSDGYQCFNNGCTLGCKTAADCGLGFDCVSGQCTPKPGAPQGSSCATDSECSSQLCQLGKCAVLCSKDSACPPGQTCALVAIGDNGPSPTTRLQPTCTARRGTGGPGAACSSDAQCDRGTCQLGICAELCAATGDCHGTALSCAKMLTTLDNGKTPDFQACLPAHKTLAVSGDGASVTLPSIAQSMAFYVEQPAFDFNNVVGMSFLTSPSGKKLYTVPMTLPDFYALPIRYQAAEGDSTMLVPNTPNVTLESGYYTYGVGSVKLAQTSVTLYIKLADPPATTGTLPLNIYLTDLGSACFKDAQGHALTVATAQAGAIDAFVGEIKAVYQQAGLTISGVSFYGAPAGTANTVREDIGSPTMPPTQYPDLDNVLRSATSVAGATPGLDVVLIKSITDGAGNINGVLGIAGGIPSSPMLGTPHSGVVVSMQTECTFGMTDFGTTAAHELGHSLGLFHSVEMDNNTDPIPDTGTAKTNVMYWEEHGGTILTAQQGQVVRNDPKVQ
jgi:hypothetical protein